MAKMSRIEANHRFSWKSIKNHEIWPLFLTKNQPFSKIFHFGKLKKRVDFRKVAYLRWLNRVHPFLRTKTDFRRGAYVEIRVLPEVGPVFGPFWSSCRLKGDPKIGQKRAKNDHFWPFKNIFWHFSRSKKCRNRLFSRLEVSKWHLQSWEGGGLFDGPRRPSKRPPHSGRKSGGFGVGPWRGCEITLFY